MLGLWLSAGWWEALWPDLAGVFGAAGTKTGEIHPCPAAVRTAEKNAGNGWGLLGEFVIAHDSG
jgi:hypothetical protein